jgi:hypothetical protein
MGCGCNKKTSSTPSGDGYLLVQATGIGANQCEAPEDADTDCPKTEPEFDEFLSGFIVPAGMNTISAQVCNASIYALSQWIETITPFCIFQIVAIGDGSITLRASLEDGSEINVNPIAGTTIPIGTIFITRGKPENISEDDVLAIINAQEQIPVENLIETTETAEVRFLGATVDDPGDTDWKKALRFIKGLFVKAGKLFMDDPLRVETTNNHHALYRHSATGEIVEGKNLSESDDLEDGKQYSQSITTTGVEFVETWFPYFFDNFITLANFNFASTGAVDQDITIVSTDILNPVKRLDHYYLDLDIEVQTESVNFTCNILINDVTVGVIGGDEETNHIIRIRYAVKIDKTANTFNFKLNGFGTNQLSYKLRTDRIYR